MTGDAKATAFVTEPDESSVNGQSFDEVVLPHLDAAHRLARWLVRNEQDAEDIVQESSLRAFRYFRTFTGGNGRAWFLRIVRHTSWSWHRGRAQPLNDLFDEERHSGTEPSADPETLLLQSTGMAAIDRAISQLPDRFRDVLTLRQVEGLSYRELAEVMNVPIGTIMSSLSRARAALRAALNLANQSGAMMTNDVIHGMKGERL
jgi:RNA polymerase sigma-70 factor (ECF subfamily)